MRVGCAAPRYSLLHTLGPHPSRSPPPQCTLLLYAASTSSSTPINDLCFPRATALQICFPPALMSAASQRTSPTAKLLQDARRALGSPAAAGCLCWAHPQDGPGPGSADCWLLTVCVEEYASPGDAEGRHFSIAAARPDTDLLLVDRRAQPTPSLGTRYCNTSTRCVEDGTLGSIIPNKSAN